MARKKLMQKVGKTPITPISVKILAVFICLLLLSNFTTNFINIMLNRSQIIQLTNKILVRQLKDIYTMASNQFNIYEFSKDRAEALTAITTGAEKGLENPDSLALGILPDGSLFFQAGGTEQFTLFPDTEALETILSGEAAGIEEGSIYFTTPQGRYISVYKYQNDWNMYLIRAELERDINAASNKVFIIISVIIIVLTLLFMILGMYMFSRILRFIRKITDSLYDMQKGQQLERINLDGAPNDDITYLGMSFNSLSSTINNLLMIFRKFVSQDVVNKAYTEHTIRLEGSQRDLAILFTDIRGFTYMTETLGNDIINLLNIHYNRAIHKIHDQKGIIGSIIGDALLAVYGTVDSDENKSLGALRSACGIISVTEELRRNMTVRKETIEKSRPLTESEESIFRAVLIDVGVGIDGGKVFYGNIGSLERMTNTVIGDNVNSASRLEGLTRIYHTPIIVSESIKIEISSVSDEFIFFELDTVLVKGKTEGRKIFIPLNKSDCDPQTKQNYDTFREGLKDYYAGNWSTALVKMAACNLDIAAVFIERMATGFAPLDWNGIWAMKSK